MPSAKLAGTNSSRGLLSPQPGMHNHNENNRKISRMGHVLFQDQKFEINQVFTKLNKASVFRQPHKLSCYFTYIHLIEYPCNGLFRDFQEFSYKLYALKQEHYQA